MQENDDENIIGDNSTTSITKPPEVAVTIYNPLQIQNNNLIQSSSDDADESESNSEYSYDTEKDHGITTPMLRTEDKNKDKKIVDNNSNPFLNSFKSFWSSKLLNDNNNNETINNSIANEISSSHNTVELPSDRFTSGASISNMEKIKILESMQSAMKSMKKQPKRKIVNNISTVIRSENNLLIDNNSDNNGSSNSLTKKLRKKRITKKISNNSNNNLTEENSGINNGDTTLIEQNPEIYDKSVIVDIPNNENNEEEGILGGEKVNSGVLNENYFLPSERLINSENNNLVNEMSQNIYGTSYLNLYEYEKQIQLILIDLGFAMALYGVPAHRLEYHLTFISKRFGVRPCQLEYTTNGILFSFFDNQDVTSHVTIFVNIDQQMKFLNLDKLCKLDNVAGRLAERKITIIEARDEIRRILKSKPIFNHFLYSIFTHILTSLSWIIVLGGSVPEMIISLVIGTVVGIFCTLAENFPYFERVNNVLNTVTSGLIATLFKLFFNGLNNNSEKYPISVFLVTICGIFSILPGIQFTTGIAELSSRHLLSGSVKLFSGFVIMLQIGFGVVVSMGIEKLFNLDTRGGDTTPSTPPERILKSVPVWVDACVLPLLILSNIFTFKVPKQILAYIFIFVVSYISFFTMVYIFKLVGSPEIAALLGAFVCGMLGNIYSHISKNPGILVTVCGIVLLIPNAYGMRGVQEFLTDQAFKNAEQEGLMNGIEFVFNLLSITVSVTIGLLLGDFIIPVRKLSF
ncbi:hypothetical protein ABK040_002628 [Willaertia magna]